MVEEREGYLSIREVARKLGLPHRGTLVAQWCEQERDPLPHFRVKRRGKGNLLVNLDQMWDWLDEHANLRRVATAGQMFQRSFPEMWSAVGLLAHRAREHGVTLDALPSAHPDQQSELRVLVLSGLRHGLEILAEERSGEEREAIERVYRQADQLYQKGWR